MSIYRVCQNGDDWTGEVWEIDAERARGTAVQGAACVHGGDVMRENEMVSAEEAREIQQTAECLGPGAEILARLARTVVALRAIIDGRTTPPTDEEAEAHFGVGGIFGMVCADGYFTGSCLSEIRRSIEYPPGRWWAYDRDGRPCAWPEVSR